MTSNGEPAQVIDLTDSSPPSPIIVLDSDSEGNINTPTSQNALSSQNSKKRKRNQKPASTSRHPSPTPNTNQNISNHYSTRPPSAKRAKNATKGSAEVAHGSENSTRPSPSPAIPDDSLFFVDVVPEKKAKSHTTAPGEQTLHTSSQVESEIDGDTSRNTLLLPGHVSLLDKDAPVEVLPPPSDATLQENFVEYLDYDDTKGMARYFDEKKEDEAVPRRLVCKKCGEEGNHIAAECTVIICLTCGVRNEHPTRSCPITKVCFGCQMKGHVIQNCPNGGRGAGSQNRGNCTRCWSDDHGSAECPTLWRMYDYVLPEEKDIILQVRESKMDLNFGEGGEGYIAMDEWCYNCGGSGHLGDDCEEEDFVHGHYGHSAFGNRNVMSGPFYDPEQESTTTKKSKRALRAWEKEGYDPVSATLARWGDKNAPDNVGKKGRTKEREKLTRLSEGQEQEEQDNWFNSRNVKNRSSRNQGQQHSRDDRPRDHAPRGSDNAPSKMSFGKISFKGAAERDDRGQSSSSNHFNPPTGPRGNPSAPRGAPTGPRGGSSSSSSSRSLLSRLGDEYHNNDKRPMSRSERRQADRDAREVKDKNAERSDWKHDRSRHDRDRDSRSYDDRGRHRSGGSSGGDQRRGSQPSQSDSRKSKDSGPRYKGGYSR